MQETELETFCLRLVSLQCSAKAFAAKTVALQEKLFSQFEIGKVVADKGFGTAIN